MDVFFRPTTCFDLLSQSPLKHALDFLAWCMMSNHVHLLIETGKAPLSKTMAHQGEHMANERTIAVYDSLSREYHRAFQVFLDHTDQKLMAQKWMTALIDRLPSRRVFVDAGAGNGKVTAWFTERFGRTIAIEPNASLRHDLERACPTADVIPEQILNAKSGTAGDLIRCSQVFYYLDAAEWMTALERWALV